jgi:Xaa-Pro aminopeptidase
VTNTATLIAGVPSDNMAVFHRTKMGAHDPVSWIGLDSGKRTLIVRDVELERAKTLPGFDAVYAYEDFTPASGLSGDRPVRAAQATAECLTRAGVERVVADRTLALVFVDALRRRGIEVVCDLDLGVSDRRSKTTAEVEAMRAATRITESAIEMACTTIARAEARADGVLVQGDEPLTSERVMGMIIAHLAQHGAVTDGCIVAGGPLGADCHVSGAGELRTGELVIVDVFPKHLGSGYHGDCTRMVVHGDAPDEAVRMHATVAEAKAAGIAAVRTGVTGEDVHKAVVGVIQGAGYRLGFPEGAIPKAGPPTGFCSMPHGTGHGLGLDLKEPPLLDFGGPALVRGDAVTVEPGLYAPGLGGVRLEDLVIVADDGCENLNALHEGLDWR